ncbi:hypothetical protein K8353_33135 [Burkholderia contaminans]|nr:hypothetical protein [Burkholderia contaminans]
MSFEFGGISFRAVTVAFGMMLAACSQHDAPVVYSPVAQFMSISVPQVSLPPDADAQVQARMKDLALGLKEEAQGQQTKRDSRVTALEQNTFLTVVRSPDDMRGFDSPNIGTSRMPSDVNPGPDDVLLVISHQSELDDGYVDTVQTVPDASHGNDSLTLRITSTKVKTPGIVGGVGYFNNNVFVIKRGKASKLILSFDDAQQAYDLGPAVR